MSTESLSLRVPDSLARELDSAAEDFLVDLLERGLRQYRLEQALDRYARGGISFGAVAHQVGISKSELARHAYARGMEPPFSDETLTEEMG